MQTGTRSRIQDEEVKDLKGGKKTVRNTRIERDDVISTVVESESNDMV